MHLQVGGDGYLVIPWVSGDADALNPPLGGSVLRSLRRHNQTKVSVATFESVRATSKVEASDFDSLSGKIRN